MIFPITDLLDDQESIHWIEKHFHPHGLLCPGCAASTLQARIFRSTKRGLLDYRCLQCQSLYNLYTGTIFAGSNLQPSRVVLLLRGVCKGEPSTVLSKELGLSRQSVHKWRKRIQENAYEILSKNALPDQDTETDEMFQNAGEKRRSSRRPKRSASQSC